MAEEIEKKVKVTVEDNVAPSIARLRELKQELKNAAAGSEEFRRISTEMQDVEDSINSAKASAGNFTEVLGKVPGPIGQIGTAVSGTIDTLKSFGKMKFSDLKASFGDLKDDVKDVFKGIGNLTGITKLYTTLNNALAKSFKGVGVAEGVAATGAKALSAALISTGIGALVVALGFLITKIMDWVDGTEEATAANEALNAVIKQQQDLLDKDLGAIDQATKVATLRAKIAGKSEEELYQIQKDGGNKRLQEYHEAEKRNIALQQEVAAKKGQWQDLSDEDQKAKLKELQESKKKIVDDYNKQKNQNEVDALTEELRIADKGRADAKAAEDKAKAAGEKARAQTLEQRKKDADAEIKIEIDKADTDEKVLKGLLDKRANLEKLSAKERQALDIDNAKKVKDALLSDAKDKNDIAIKAYEEDQKLIDKAYKDRFKTIDDGLTNELDRIDIAVSEGKKKQEDARKEAYAATLKATEDQLNLLIESKKKEADALAAQKDISPEERKKAELAIEQKYDQQILDGQKRVNGLKVQNTIDTNNETRQANENARQEALLGIENELNDINTSYERKLELVKQGEALLLKQEGLTAEQRKAIQKRSSDEAVAIKLAEIDAKTQLELAWANNAAMAGKLIQEIAGKNKSAAKAGIIVEQAAGAATIVINTLAGIAKLQVKPGFPAGIPMGIALGIQGALGVAQAIMAAKKGIEAIDQADAGGGGGSAAAAPAQTGSKFAKGGILVGPSHAGGGIKSPFGELEGGEFVVNKRSTSSFMPLLHAINSVGNSKHEDGGMVGSLDSIRDMLANQSMPVVKTYVVASDVTTQAEADAKISRLARL